MKISFLIPAFNAESTLEEAVNSILDQKAESQKELIIIDDGSRDNTLGVAKKLKEKYPDIKLIEKKNGGEASALNAGLEKVSGDFVALVEADVQLEVGWLGKVLKEFDKSEVMGAGGCLVTSRDEPWIARIAGYEVENKFATKERYPKHITSANAIYRSEVFEEIGKFDEKLVNASLDSDVNSRLIDKGYKLAYVRDAKALHHYKPTFLGYLKRQYNYARYRIYVKNLALYPADKLLAFNVFLSGLFIFSLLLIHISFYIPLVILFFILWLQIPVIIKLLKAKKDSVLLIYPFVIVLRNIVAFFGYGIGLINKRFLKR